jgi:hypothetical protein
MNFNPPLRLGAIQVTSLHKAPVRSVHMILNLNGHTDLSPLEIKMMISRESDRAIEYLIAEGYISDEEKSSPWLKHIGTVFTK